jgi:hypothetical protein
MLDQYLSAIETRDEAFSIALSKKPANRCGLNRIQLLSSNGKAIQELCSKTTANELKLSP